MPRRPKGLGRPQVKHGTNNVKQAAVRDAAAAEAERRAAAAARAAAKKPEPPPPVEEPPLVPVEPTYIPAKGDMEAHKRMAIIFAYEQLNCPPVSEWAKHGGTLRQIADQLGMPDPCDYRPIRQTLERHLSGEDIWYTKGGQGGKPTLPYGARLIAADCLRSGTGQDQAAFIVTAWREKKGMSKEEAKVGRKAIKTGFDRLGGVVSRRGTTSTGSRDPESKWATSRCAQAEQWQAQVETPRKTAAWSAPGPTMDVEGKQVETLANDPLSLLGKDIVIKVLGSTWPGQPKAVRKQHWPCKLVGYIDEYTYVNGDQEAAYVCEELSEGHCYAMRVDDVVKLLPPALRPADGGANVLGKIPLESISWWDEKHKQISLSSYASKHEYRLPTTPGGTHKHEEEGGVMQPREPRVKAKYTGDGARYGFGVMMKRDKHGELEGYKMKPFNYSDSWLCGPKKYKEREAAEHKRVSDFTRDGWGEAGLGVSEATATRPGGRYQIRYGDEWRKEFKLACSKTLGAKESPTLKGYICVTDLMDHVVAESIRLFAGTPYADSFVIFHDALKQWWEPEAQDHLFAKHGIGPDRQLCIQGSTNEAVAKHYQNRLVGDTPEFCPLDSNLFADYEKAMRQNLAYTHWLEHDHPEKFLSGTAKQVQRLMEVTWAHDDAVRSERIVEDICRFPAALAAIIAAKGAKVEHLGRRYGRRAARAYEPPRIKAVEELLQKRFERLDPTPATAPDAGLPPKKRRRVM